MNITNPSKHRPITALVIGGRGFIGHDVAESLRAMGVQVLIGTRLRNSPGFDSQFRTTRMERLLQPEAWAEVLKGVDVVINSVGILRQRSRETYERVHHLAVAAMAQACAARQIRLVHVSIMGTTAPTRSRFATSKLRGEQAVQRSGADWYIVRPSLVDGERGYGARWFRRVATWPIHFMPENATGHFAPVDSRDLGEAIAKIAVMPDAASDECDRIFEFGGERIVTVAEYLRLLDSTERNAPLVVVPAWLARFVSHCCDILHVTPFSFGHYELLQYANYPMRNRLREVLGRCPRTVSAGGLCKLQVHDETYSKAG